MVIMIAIIVFEEADISHLIEEFLEFLLVFGLFFVLFAKGLEGIVMADLHREGDVGHLIGDDFRQTPIFGVLHRDRP